MKNNIGNYTTERLENGDLKINYKRSVKDVFYIIVYLIIATPILVFDFKLVRFLANEKMSSNVIIGYFIAVCMLLIGLFFLIVSIETFIKPTKSAFLISTSKKQLTVKLNLFKKLQLSFNEIKQFDLGAKDITITNYNKGRTYKRPLFLIFLHVELFDSRSIKIHQFEGTSLFISSSEKKKNKSLKEVSKQITMLIAQECGKEFHWTGTQKE